MKRLFLAYISVYKKTCLPFYTSVFIELSGEKGIFQIEAQNQLILRNTLIFQ